MNCRKVSHLLSAFMDGELPGVEHRQIHEHLNRCIECRAEYEGLLQMKRLLGGLRIQAPRKDLPAVILQKVADEEWRAANQTPSAWLRQFVGQLQEVVVPPRTVGLSIGITCVAVFLLMRLATPNTEQSTAGTITWDTATPPLSAFTTGLDSSGSRRFLSQPISIDHRNWERADGLLLTPAASEDPMFSQRTPRIPMQNLLLYRSH